jgi:hypothetical protein
MTAVPYITVIVLITAGIYGCKKPYNPPAITADNKFLAIEGTLVSSIDSPSVIALSRTTRLSDTSTIFLPETNAIVSVEGDNGDKYNFSEAGSGNYRLSPVLFNTSVKYRLRITTASNEDYASDFVEVKQPPPIDSLTWQQNSHVMIYLNTHDPSNSTRYYRWDFAETWQYTSKLNASLSQDNGVMFYVNSTNQTYNCWHTAHSSGLLTGTSIALTNDVINMAPIAIVPQNSQKISIRYSVLVKQYALSADAYHYFSVLKKNTENLGSVFDAQPATIKGNIHSIKNASEIVIGFFTASSVTQKRIFITKNDVTNWNYVYEGPDCLSTVRVIPPDSNNIFAYSYFDPSYAPYYFYDALNLFIASKACVDCRVEGGTNQKPAYW